MLELDVVWSSGTVVAIFVKICYDKTIEKAVDITVDFGLPQRYPQGR